MMESAPPAPVYRIDVQNPDTDLLEEGARLLKEGGVVVFPTETFYGLGGDALSREAVLRVCRIKGRPPHMPLLCLVDKMERVGALASEVPAKALALMEAFWPGPLTLVLPPRRGIPEALVGPTGGVAVRWSAHPVAVALVAFLDSPLTGTSANVSGSPAPSRVEELSAAIRRGADLILDAGPTSGGVPSTVLDCTRSPMRILREGAVSCRELRPFL